MVEVATSDPEDARRVWLVSARDAGEMITGATARHRSLREHYERMGVEVEEHALRSPSGKGLLQRRLETMSRLVALLRRVRREDIVHVEGLGSPVMVLVAWILRLRPSTIRFDACDSWHLLELQQQTDRDARRMGRGAKLQRALLRNIDICYVASDDAEADLSVGAAASVLVIGNTVDPDVRSVAKFDRCRTERLSVSGLFNSPHIAPGLATFCAAWTSVPRSMALPDVHFYGTPMDAVPAMLGAHREGYARSVADLYEGACVVVVLNRRTSGVPNKLLEAVAAQRPMIVHSDLAPMLEPHPMVWQWFDESTMRKAIVDACISEWDFTRPIALRSIRSQ